MEPDLGFYLEWLERNGVDFAVAGDLVREPDHDGPLVVGDEPTREFCFDGIHCFVEHRDPAAGIAADHASESVVRLMLPYVEPGCRVWDIGCGTGVLAMAAALAGARVIGTDLNRRALEFARLTAAESNVDMPLYEGSVLEPIPEGEEADMVVANLPHKPTVEGAVSISQAGGPEGDQAHSAFVCQADRRLAPGTRVFFFLHSLPDPRLLRAYAERFDLSLLAWKRRWFQPGEYGDLQEYFVRRSAEGASYVVERDGRRFLIAGVWMAVRS